MNKLSTIVTAAAAAALLSVNPLAAQTQAPEEPGMTNPEVEPRQSLDERVTEDRRAEIYQSFRTFEPAPSTVTFDATVGATVPETVTLHEIPAELGTVHPELTPYRYTALPHGEIAIVHPETRAIEMLLTE